MARRDAGIRAGSLLSLCHEQAATTLLDEHMLLGASQHLIVPFLRRARGDVYGLARVDLIKQLAAGCGYLE